MSKKPSSFQSISVIVPENPFLSKDLQAVRHCLTALDVEKLMGWWPGTPHSPHRDAQKVKAIQRALDWKRVVQIAAYLLQREILAGADLVDKYFREIYEPQRSDPARQWPPRVPKVVGFQRSAYPTFSNVLLHVNGAEINPEDNEPAVAKLTFDERDPALRFSVIDGQHRINGAYLAVKILSGERKHVKWDVPAEIFLDLDKRDDPPRKQAQIFIDVNFYQKKVDRSLVADLFPTARGHKDPLDDKERAQDLGRKLMLEVGPLVGMIQIPGIKYGVKDVVTLSTLNSAIEDVISFLNAADLEGLEEQAEFLAQCFEAWLAATGRMEKPNATGGLSPDNVVYQGRVLVSIMTLVPAIISALRKKRLTLISDKSLSYSTDWLKDVATRAGLLKRGVFLSKTDFREKEFLGSGGLARFRDTLWAAALSKNQVDRLSAERIAKIASDNRGKVFSAFEK
jgi:DGQHR domain-containing protein